MHDSSAGQLCLMHVSHLSALAAITATFATAARSHCVCLSMIGCRHCWFVRSFRSQLNGATITDLNRLLTVIA